MKSLIHWHRSPRSELRNRLDRMFEPFFGDPWSEGLMPIVFGNGARDLAFVPSVEVKETDSEIVVRAELPGVDAKDVEVELLDGLLVLSGKKEERREEKEGESTHSEFRCGSFRREVALPAEVETDAVKATCERGILTVEMKKSKASKARKINVESR